MAPAFALAISSTQRPNLSFCSTTNKCLSIVNDTTTSSIKRRAYHFDFDIAQRPSIPRPLGAAGGTTILWLRGVDLRIRDATALVAACTQHASVAPVFVLRGNENVATLSALRALRAQFRSLGGDLYIRQGMLEKVLPSLASRVHARVVHTTRAIKVEERARVGRIEASLRNIDIGLVQHWDGFVRSPDTLPFPPAKAPKSADEFNRRVAHLPVERSLPPPESVSVPAAMGDAGQIPCTSTSKSEHGELAAWSELNKFISGERLAVVKSKIGTSYSKLEEQVCLGCISARSVYEEVNRRLKRGSLKLHCAVMQLMLQDFFNVENLNNSNTRPVGKMSTVAGWCK